MRFHPARLIVAALVAAVFLFLFGLFAVSPGRILRAALGENSALLEWLGIGTVGSPEATALSPAPAPPAEAAAEPRPRSNASLGLRYEPFFSSMLVSHESLAARDEALQPALSNLREWESRAASDREEGEDALRRLHERGDLDASEWQEANRILDRAEPFLGAVRQAAAEDAFPVVGLPDDPALDALQDRGAGESDVAALVENASRLLCLRAGSLMHMGNFAQAMRALSDAAEIASLSSNATMTVQRAQADAMNGVADTWAALLRGEQDPRRLSSALREMTTIQQKWEEAARRVSDPVARDLLARVAAYRQSGVEIDPRRLAPDELYAQLDAAKRERVERLGDRFQHDDELRRRVEQRLDAQMDKVRDMVDEAVRFRREQEAAEDPATSAPLNAFRVPESAVKAKLDVLRLDAAARLYRRADGAETPPDPESLSPRYIPVASTDPFAGASYRVDPETDSYYSVGPDRTDDGARIPYDSTNGTLSRGDIYLKPKK